MYSMPMRPLLTALSMIVLWTLAATAGTSQETGVAATPGAAFDAAPFATAVSHDAGISYSLCWGEPRKIRRVEVEFPPDEALPAASAVRLQYWRGAWDGKPDPVQAETQAGSAGWAANDDWTNGRWQDADARLTTDGRRWTYTFAPTGNKEFPNLGQPGVAYRRTLKVRLLADGGLPKPRHFRALTDAVYHPLTVRILWDEPAAAGLRFTGPNPGRLDVYNGLVRAVRPYGDARVTVGDDLRWVLPPGVKGGIEADLLMAVDPGDGRYDRAIVTVRTQHNPFSFAADEVAAGERVFVDDLGALVVRGDDSTTVAGRRDARRESAGRTVYDRVSEAEEQTLSRAWNDMPLKRPLWFVHGLPGNRNAMHQYADGEIEISGIKRWFDLPNSPKDSQRKLWSGDRLYLRFGFPADGRGGGRELLEGYLPRLRSWWVDGPIYYEQVTVLDTLDGRLDAIRLDDPTVLLMQVRVVNTSPSAAGTAKLRLTSHAGGDETLSVDGDRVMAASPSGSRFRYLFQTGGHGTTKQDGRAVAWSMELAAGESHELSLAIPSITLDREEEIAALRKRDFAAADRRIGDFWRRLTAQSTEIETPEPWLTDFHKAVLRHLEVNCVRDAALPRRYAHVGTFGYGAFPNESAMMIAELDRRGCHRAAEECLQAFLDCQGTVPLPGNFSDAEGLFYGAAGHECGGYNKHHGYTMWCMAEHWRMTRDRRWMDAAAAKLVKACDWVTRQRQLTMKKSPDGGRPIEYGFLPAGGLEDVQDYWHWLATNVNTVWGFDALAAALADYGHTEAARLQHDAKAYHDDVMRGLTEARIRTPVVRLRDASYVPKYPSHLHERGRARGWIRETLEGAMFLPIDGLLPPDAPETAWILKDYEDNLYISDRYGYSIPVFDQFWFSRGGFSMQANLLEGPLAYLGRDEIKHFLRAYFNGFASAFYPEIRMCNEHSMPELGYPAGDHFKSSDESNVAGWLRMMFVREQGDDLYLGQAIPRDWLAQGRHVGITRAASHFGPLSLRIVSRADQGEIAANLTPPERNRPKTIYLRFRHPQGKPMQGVTLNGKEYDKFDVQKEWIVLPGDVRGPQHVVARY